MDNNLTLKIDKEAIEKAKICAKNNTNLSALLEYYFNFLTQHKMSQLPIILTVKALSGMLKLKRGMKPDDMKEYYLTEKYLHEQL